MTILSGRALGQVSTCWPVITALALVLLCIVDELTVDAQPWAATIWTDAHATFYGGQDASGTMGGACGYGNLYSSGYGTSTAALSVALFNNGLSCGACYQIVCQTDQNANCYAGESIIVTATNECPDGSYGGWCNSPKLHFDLSYPMFTTLAPDSVGVIPIQYRRISCSKVGGVIFTMNGNPNFFLVLAYNVAGGGDVASMLMKGDSSNWYTMTQNWGENWELDDHSELIGQGISFMVTLGSGVTMSFLDVAPSNWTLSSSYQALNNFM
ncbi:unnamed protein product [Calypogeia fissa]